MFPRKFFLFGPTMKIFHINIFGSTNFSKIFLKAFNEISINILHKNVDSQIKENRLLYIRCENNLINSMISIIMYYSFLIKEIKKKCRKKRETHIKLTSVFLVLLFACYFDSHSILFSFIHQRNADQSKPIESIQSKLHRKKPTNEILLSAK